ncbi:MAG: glycosyltransferase family 4 protein [Planctomycetota bacterium]
MDGDSDHTAQQPIRVLMQQAAMPAFRVPYYRSLASRDSIDLTVLYGELDLPNVEPEGFKSEFRRMKVLPGGFKYDARHMQLLTPGAWDALSMAWNTRFLSLFPGIRRAKKLGMGVVVWGHGYSKSEGTFRSWLRFKAGEMADAVVLYSRSVADDYIDRGMPKEKVFVALNSLDPGPMQDARSKILADPEGLAAFKREHGLRGDDGTGPVIIYVSRLDPNNRVPMLVEATKKLLDEFPALKTVVIGKGPDLDNVKATAERLGIADCVICPGAVYGEDNIGPWLCSSDVFCYPTNIGLSILHAMNYALPVVTSDHIESQNPEIEALRDGENGLLYHHGSVDDLASKLATLLRDRELRERLGNEAHRTATEDYHTDRMADGMEAALRFANQRATAKGR